MVLLQSLDYGSELSPTPGPYQAIEQSGITGLVREGWAVEPYRSKREAGGRPLFLPLIRP
jgi:hypothetical protein